MLKFSLAVITILLAVALAEPRVQLHRGLTATTGPNGHPYLFLTVPRGRGGAVVQGFEVLDEEVNDNFNNAANNNEDDDDDDDNVNNDDEEDDGDDDGNVPIIGFGQRAALSDKEVDDIGDDDDDDDDDNDGDDDNMTGNTAANVVQVLSSKNTSPTAANLQMILQNAKPTQMVVSKEHAGAIMVPDGIIEIEGQSIIDEKTGKPALLVPREALDVIPDGSVVALMERSAGDDEEERANRVIVRRRRRGSRRNVRRRGGNNRVRRRRVNNNNNNRNKRRRVNKRKNVRVIRYGGNNNRRRRGNNRRRNGNRPVVIQG